MIRALRQHLNSLLAQGSQATSDSLLPQFAALLSESRCPVCAVPVEAAPLATAEPSVSGKVFLTLCASCAPALTRRAGGYCERCGAIAAWPELPPALCGICLSAIKPRPWRRFFLHGAYAGLLRDLLLRFKLKHELSLGGLLGTLLAEHPGLASGEYDAVIPMPLHPRRLRQRGFNQSLELARPLALKIATPLASELLLRVGHTPPQTSLHYSERHSNVRGIFAAKSGVRKKRVLLVDDVATTGATLEEAAETLLGAGAVFVDAAVVARTPDHTAG